MKFAYCFLLTLFCLASYAVAQAPAGIVPFDSLKESGFTPPPDATQPGESPLFRTVTSSGKTSVESYSPGSTVISIMHGDSTLGTYSVSSNDEVMVIVEFASPAISTVHSVVEKSPSPRLQSALSAARNDHERFKADLPLIESNPPPGARIAFAAPLTTIRYEYETALNGVALTTRRWVLEEIRKLPYVTNVDLDPAVQVFDDSSNALIGAPQFWSVYGLHADSIDIGIIDTGIDYFHEALGGAAFPNSKVVGGYDIINHDADPMDDNGHGTHVAGIAAGYGPPPLNLRGVAYGARLWAFKVLNSSGQGFSSQIIAGINLALDPDSNPATPTPISVLNISIGGSGNPNDALSRSVDNAVSSGVVCAVAAGNSGPGYSTINSPGCARKALTVGACDNTDVIAPFSSRGPASLLYGIKPDLLAPGVAINSAKLGGGYTLLSGTSMATPHVAGAAALLRKLHPTWTAEAIQANLTQTAHDLSLDVWTQGHGRLDIMAAAAESTVVTPPSLAVGFDLTSQSVWSVRETLKVRNFKLLPEVFGLSTQNATPAGITVSFDAATLPVAAHDSASVGLTVAVDNNVYPYPTNNPPSYSNSVVAQSTITSDQVTIPFAFIKSPIFNLIFDVPPTLVDIHNNNDSNFFNVGYANLIGTGLSLLVPADSYDVVTLFYTDSQMVVKEGIKVAGVKTVNIHSTDARNAVNIHLINAQGHEFTSKRLELESIVSNRSKFGISLFGAMTHKYRFLGDMSANYKYELTTIPDFFLSGSVLYEFPFVVTGGITGDVTLQNDPAAFKRVDYRIAVPPNTTRLNVTTVFSSSTFGLGTTSIGTVYPPYQMSAYYLPSPFQENFPYLQHWFATNPFDILGSLLHRTGYTSVSEPDTMNFALGPTGFHAGTAMFTSTRPTFTNPVGITPPMWGGKIINLGSQIDAQVATDSYFFDGFGDRTVGPFTYQLSANGVPVSSGIIQNLPRIHLDTLLPLTGGPFEFDATYSSFRVGPRQATAIARISGNSNNSNTFCPRFRNLVFLRNGDLPDSLPVNQLRIVPNCTEGTDSVKAYYRKSTSSVWIPLTVSVHDSTHTAALPETLGVGYYSARVRITDSAASVMDYTLEPGFIMPGTILDTASLVFDTIRVGCRQVKYIGVQNLRLVTNTNVQSIVSDDDNFILTGPQGGTIAGAESLNCEVTFTPRSGGAKHGHIIFNIAGFADPETVSVSGVAGSVGGEITISAVIGSGWQLISAPVSSFCPYSLPPLYAYRGTYLVRDTLSTGDGYWKSLTDSTTDVTFVGFPLTTDTINAFAGWNLIGSLSSPIPTGSLTTIPAGMITSRVFGYSQAGYVKPDSILPSHGYWVKVAASCKLILNSSGGIAGKPAQADLYGSASTLTITDAAQRSRTLYFGTKADLPADQRLFELPPVPPGGALDVRFGSNRDCEVVADGKAHNFPVRILSAAYPVTISWDLKSPELLPVLRIGSSSTEMTDRGSAHINGPADTLVLRIAGSAPLPKTFALDQNFPNPFNPQTVIQYQLPVDSRVTLKIFNVLGKEVTSLAGGIEPAGYKTVTWNGTDVASGVYFCRLQAAGVTDPSKTFTQVRKLVLIR